MVSSKLRTALALQQRKKRFKAVSDLFGQQEAKNQIGWKFGKLSSDKERIGLSSRLNWSHCIFGPGLITSAHHNVYHHTLTKTLSTHIKVYWLTNLKTISDKSSLTIVIFTIRTPSLN